MYKEKYTYFNAPIYVEKSNPQSNDYSARYEDTTLTNILKDTKNTDFAIERYSMNCGGTLPILDFVGNYTITISGTYSHKTITQTTPLAMTNIYGNQTQSPTLLYSMHHFVDIVNTAFNNCFTNMQNSILNYTILTQPPFIEFEPTTNLFTLYTDNTGFGTTPNGNNESFNITFSNDLFNLLRNFYFNIDSLNNATLLISKSPFSQIQINSSNWTKNIQMFCSTNSWSPVRDVQFRTNLPVSFEYYGDISVLGTGLSIGDNYQSSQEQVITDITIDNVCNEWNEHILYNSSKYRWINMQNIRDLKDVKFTVYWNHKNGQSYPLLMPNFGSIELKLLFKRME